MSHLKYAVKFNDGWIIISDDEKSHQSPMLSCQRLWTIKNLRKNADEPHH